MNRLSDLQAIGDPASTLINHRSGIFDRGYVTVLVTARRYAARCGR